MGEYGGRVGGVRYCAIFLIIIIGGIVIKVFVIFTQTVTCCCDSIRYDMNGRRVVHVISLDC